jgi:hypothetical protein
VIPNANFGQLLRRCKGKKQRHYVITTLSFGGLSGASFGIRSWASLIVAVSITKWFLIKGCALAPGEHARHGARRSSKNGFGRAKPRSQQPRIFDARRAKTPNDSRAGAVGGSVRWRSVRRYGTAAGRASRLGTALRPGVHERMNEGDNREARASGGVSDRRPATIGVPAEDLSGEAQAPHGVGAGGQLHASRRHLKDVRAAGCVEHFRPLQTKRKPVDGETPRRRYVAAPAPKREVQPRACRVNASDHGSAPKSSSKL